MPVRRQPLLAAVPQTIARPGDAVARKPGRAEARPRGEARRDSLAAVESVRAELGRFSR